MSVKKDFTQEMVGAIAQGAVRIIGQDLAGASIRKHEGADEGGDVETIIRVSAHEVDEEYSDEWTHGFVGDVEFKLSGKIHGQVMLVLKLKIDEGLALSLLGDDWIDKVGQMATITMDGKADNVIGKLGGLYGIRIGDEAPVEESGGMTQA